MKTAVFDHVDEQGNLILSIDGEKVALDVTDVLERGILSAKQIKAENNAATAPVEPAALPISSIQTMVREGHSDEEIAAKYSIDASLVRRFAQPVETEKHYAIAQFLSVTMQTGAAMRKLESIISHNLLESGIDPKDVVWEATKQGRNPWKIEARFTRRDQEYKATWMWNLRDNSVVSINPVAKRLLGENASAGTLLFGEDPVVTTSSRAIQAALNGRGPIPPSWMTDLRDDNGGNSTDAPREATPTPASDTSVPRAGTPAAETPLDTHGTPAPSSEQLAETIIDSTRKAQQQTAAAAQPTTSPADEEKEKAEAQKAAASATEDAREPKQPSATSEKSAKSKTAKPEKSRTPGNTAASTDSSDRTKKRRAAVPSWDDILFGD
ncbi:MAG: septation protein SepH [Bifidobacteriaceae bacterium]|nr:septation protein SepH [Bifidobacteriaceae bacterium]